MNLIWKVWAVLCLRRRLRRIRGNMALLAPAAERVNRAHATLMTAPSSFRTRSLDYSAVGNYRNLEIEEQIVLNRIDRITSRPATTKIRVRYRRKLRINGAIDWFSIFIPRRIADEELGDALEQINERLDRGERWKPITQAIMACLWAALHSVFELMPGVSLGGSKK